MRLMLVTLSLIGLVGCGSNFSDGPSDAKILSPENIQSPDDIQSLAADLGGFCVEHHLSLANTKVTDAGVAELQQSLPNCRVSH